MLARLEQAQCHAERAQDMMRAAQQLISGGLELARSVLHLPFNLPVFAILLLTLGALLLGREVLRIKS